MVVQGAPLILFAVDRDGVFTLSEGRGLASLGVKPGEAVGQSIFERYKDEPEVIAAANRAMHGEAFTVKARVKGLTFEATVTPIVDGEGKVERVVGVAMEVTEREKAEGSLRESEERYRQLMAERLRASQERYFALAQAAPDSIAVIDSTGVIHYTNPAMESLFGFRAGELTKQNILPLILGLNLERLNGGRPGQGVPIARVTARPIELVGLDRLGKKFPIELSISSYEEVGGWRYVLIVRDIVERKTASEQLEDMNRFLDSIVENIPDMIFVKDAERLSFVRFNKAGEELLGYSREQLLGKTDYDFFPKEEADFFTNKDREVLSSGKLLDIREEPIQTAKLGLRLLHTKKIPILGAKGEPRYLLGIAEDITEKKQMEAKLVEQSRMAGIGQVAAGIAHEVRNPLFGISSVGQILAKEVEGKKELKELSRQMLDEISRVKKLVEDLLLFARPQQSQDQSFSPEKLWKEVSAIPQPLAIKKRIQLEETLSLSSAELRGNPEQIRQVLINLYLNALQFSPDGGTVQVRSRFENAKNREWIFSIRNGGPPMEPEHRAHIFEPFFSTRKGGAGLGLAVCKKIVEEHSGSIDVTSDAKSGTVFEIRITVR